MQDRQLYQQILGIVSPWFVSRVELGLEAGEVHVYLEHKKTADRVLYVAEDRKRTSLNGL